MFINFYDKGKVVTTTNLSSECRGVFRAQVDNRFKLGK